MRPLQLGQALDLRSRFGRPYGGRAGVNLGHPAAKNLLFSAVASANGFIAVAGATPGAAGAPTNAPTNKSQAVIGPAVRYANGFGTFTSFSGQTALASETVGTLGMIFSGVTDISGNPIWFENTSSGTGLCFIVDSSSTHLAMFRLGGGNTLSTLPMPTTGHPYFLGGSFDAANDRLVLMDLLTGQLVSQAYANGSSVGTPNGTYRIGPAPQGNGNINISAVMHANVALNMQQLTQWALDPWSFWYPRREQAFVGVTAAPASPAMFTVSGGGVCQVFPEFFADVVRTDAPVCLRTN